MTRHFATLSFALALAAAAASAQQTPDAAQAVAADPNNPWATGGYQAIPLPEVEGTVPWDTLAEVELVPEGPDLIPEYGGDVIDLKGEQVKMVGFMLPLDSSGTRVLLSRYAPHCPFCMTAGPESFVELVCDEPIEMSLEPIVVTGTFEVLEDAWQGYYYRMNGTKVVAR